MLFRVFYWLFLLVGFVLSTLVPIFNLPEPNGPYHVGTETFHWIDSTRNELFTIEDTTDYREIIVQVWYPSKGIKERFRTLSRPYKSSIINNG